MKEVKSPKKPLLYYYGIVLLIIALFNLLVTPLLNRRSIEEVDYGTFMTMTENKEIGRVEVQDNQILFTNKDDTQIYKTGPTKFTIRKRAARPSTARASWTTRA